MRVLNVPASAPFLRTVITALVDGALIEGFRPRTPPPPRAETTHNKPTPPPRPKAPHKIHEVEDLD
jgi:ATP-dependent helicase/nuclease subunit B